MPLGTLAGAFLSPVLGQVTDKIFPKLNGLGSTIGNAIGGIFGRQDSVDTSLAAQKGLFDYQAEYNSPLNQRLRLEEAGYNPALMYGATSTWNESMPTSNVGAYGFGVDPYQMSKIGNTNSNTDLTRAKIASEKLQQTLSSLDVESKRILNDIAFATKDAKIQMSTEELSLLQHKISKINAEMDVLFESAGLKKAETAMVWEKLAGLQATNDINNLRYQIEKELGYFGNSIVQTYIGMGADFITDLIGIARIFKSAPKLKSKHTDTFDRPTWGGRQVDKYETFEYE